MTHPSNQYVCRVCLNESERTNLLNLHPTLIEKLLYVDQLSEGESLAKLSKYICKKCEIELEFAYKFIIKMKLSKLRLQSLSKTSDAERENDDTKPFIEEKPIFEGVQINGDRNDVDEDVKMPLVKLETSPMRISSIIELDRRQIEVLDDIGNPSTKIETSPSTELIPHIQEHEEICFICTYENCKSSFPQRSLLQLHTTHEDNHPFMCNEESIKKEA